MTLKPADGSKAAMKEFLSTQTHIRGGIEALQYLLVETEGYALKVEPLQEQASHVPAGVDWGDTPATTGGLSLSTLFPAATHNDPME